MKSRYAFFLLHVVFFISCSSAKKTTSGLPAIPDKTEQPDSVRPIASVSPIRNMTKTDTFLEDLMKAEPANFSHILTNRDSLRVQIIYTQINRQANNNPIFNNYYFNVSRNNFFYPASTVKMPVAVLALQRLNELKVVGLNSQSSMITETNFSGQTAVNNDPTTPDGRPSISNYIKKIFLVSDNDAFNRLYEFLGQQYINEQLHKKGYENAEILHRLSITLSEEENRHTNPVHFFNPEGNSLYGQPMQVNEKSYSKRDDFIGRGYYSGDTLVNEPFNFSKKNRIALEDLTDILKSILFPASVPVGQRFNLKPEDYPFVWKYMSQLPSETRYPPLDSATYWDSYGKYLFYGAEKTQLPKHVRIFNKVGDAYGFLTDIAYIVDFQANVEFMLSATIYCNSDEIVNDDKYDYETVGFPFLKNLGKLIYDYESKRTRKFQPNLSAFKLAYDK